MALEGMPPGYRFIPGDEELIHYYLKTKIDHEVALLPVKIFNVYYYPPWDLARLTNHLDTKDDQYYYVKLNKIESRTRPIRTVGDIGWWKSTGGDKSFYDSEGKEVGHMKPLTFFRFANNSQLTTKGGKKTDWIMHEYSLVDPTSAQGSRVQVSNWVLCRIRESGRGGEMLDSEERRLKRQKTLLDSQMQQISNISFQSEVHRLVRSSLLENI